MARTEFFNDQVSRCIGQAHTDRRPLVETVEHARGKVLAGVIMGGDAGMINQLKGNLLG